VLSQTKHCTEKDRTWAQLGSCDAEPRHPDAEWLLCVVCLLEADEMISHMERITAEVRATRERRSRSMQVGELGKPYDFSKNEDF
jgi:hypothetical protein